MGLSRADWQEVVDFTRFLRLAGTPEDRIVLAHPRGYAWRWYMEGVCGAPPLMWEGDDN